MNPPSRPRSQKPSRAAGAADHRLAPGTVHARERQGHAARCSRGVPRPVRATHLYGICSRWPRSKRGDENRHCDRHRADPAHGATLARGAKRALAVSLNASASRRAQAFERRLVPFVVAQRAVRGFMRAVIDAVELLRDLIRFDTTNPPGNEESCVAFVEALLREHGIESERVREGSRPAEPDRAPPGLERRPAAHALRARRRRDDGRPAVDAAAVRAPSSPTATSGAAARST